MMQGGAVLSTEAVSAVAKCLLERLEAVFDKIEYEIIPRDERYSLDKPLFSASVTWCGDDGDCFAWSEDETSYCQQIAVDAGNGRTAHIVLACSCPERPEWIFLLCYLVDMVAERLRTILFERKAVFLLGDSFCFYGSGNDLEDENTVAVACLADAYHQISREIGRTFHLSFDVIDQLSLTNYEQEGAKGVVLVAPQALIDKVNPCVWVCGSDESAGLSTEDIRFVRKLMAGAAPDALLFGVSPEKTAPRFCGVVLLSKDRLPPNALRTSCAQVTINGPMNWGLSLFGRPVCRRYHTKGFQLPRGLS